MASLDLDRADELNIEARKGDTFNISMTIKKPGSYGNITDATHSSGVVTVTASNSLSVGDYIHIKDVLGMTDINGNHYITGASGSDFTISHTSSETYLSGGQFAEFDTNYDLSSGYTAKVDIKTDPTGSETLALTSASEITLGDGTIDIDIAAASMNMAAGTYYYDFEITKTSDSTVDTLFYGTFTVNQDTTD